MTQKQTRLVWLFVVMLSTLTAWATWVLITYLQNRLKSGKKERMLPQRILSRVMTTFKIRVEEYNSIVVPKLQPPIVGLLVRARQEVSCQLIPYTIIDLTPPSSTCLPEQLSNGSVKISVEMLSSALDDQEFWCQHYPNLRKPTHHDILLMVGSEKQMAQAATTASELGFDRVATLDGSIERYRQYFEMQTPQFSNTGLLSSLKELLNDIFENEENEESDDEDANINNDELTELHSEHSADIEGFRV